MQATIERAATSVLPQRCVPPDMSVQDTPIPYKAPLATFLVLVASARASACSGDPAMALCAHSTPHADD